VVLSGIEKMQSHRAIGFDGEPDRLRFLGCSARPGALPGADDQDAVFGHDHIDGRAGGDDRVAMGGDRIGHGDGESVKPNGA